MANLFSLLVSYEYRNDIKSKSFWIGTIALPIIMIVFGFIIAYLMDSSEIMRSMYGGDHSDTEMSAGQAIGMMSCFMLVVFIMIYGAQIFNKVKTEKTNRISEVLVGSVPGRTLMISKVVSVALIGFTQILAWIAMGVLAFGMFAALLPVSSIVAAFFSPSTLLYLVVAILYFVGGYLFYGSLYAACGALTDRNNENQSYMTTITMALMMSMYLGMFATDNGASALAQFCFYLPFTSPAVGGVLGVGGIAPWWQTVISLVVLYASAFGMMAIAGKIYTSALLLKGKKLSFKDITTFLKAR